MQELANAIVLQAVEDYRNALNGKSYEPNLPPEVVVKRLERFFRSNYFALLTTVKGEYLIEKLNEEHREKVERRENESNVDTSNT